MAGLIVLGTYDASPESLFEVDLMRLLARSGVGPSAIVFKTSDGAAKLALNQPMPVGSDRTVLQVRGFDDREAVAAIQALQPDLLVYAGGRDILRAPLLATARLGCIGGHYGLLPKIRGMATVEWSLMLDVPPTVAVQRINAGIDTGDVLIQAKVPLLKGDTFMKIRERSYYITKLLLTIAAKGLMAERLAARPQERLEGTQYFRLHPQIHRLAERRLAARLAAVR